MGVIKNKPAEILRSEQGVSIIFACLVLAVFMILGSVVLAFGYSNYSRSTAHVTRSQSYEAVSSGVQLVRSQIDGKKLAVSSKDGNFASVKAGGAPQWLVNLLNDPAAGAAISMKDANKQVNDVKVTCIKKGQRETASFNIVCSEAGEESGIELGFALRLTDPKLASGSNSASYTVTLDAQEIYKARE